MKKLLLAAIALLSLLPMNAQDVIQFLPKSANAGVVEDDEEYLSLQMVNTVAPTLLQLTIAVPEGMTLITDYVDLNPDRFDGTTRRGVFTPFHTVDFSRNDDGTYLLIIYDNDLGVVKGSDGEIAQIYFETSENMAPGYYPIIISDTKMAVDENPEHGKLPDTSVSYVKVGSPAANTVYNLGGTADEQLLVPSFVQTALEAENNVVVNGTCQNLVLADGADYVANSSFTAASATYNATVSEGLGYKTIVLPYAVDVPAGFEAYTVGSVVGNELTMNAVSTIPANTPAILKNAGTAVMAASNVTVEAIGEVKPADGVLVGTYEAINAPIGSYVLQNHDGNVAFYPVTEAAQPVVGAFRAYLTIPSNEAQIRVVFDGEATGIEDASDAIEGNAVYYNIAGQRVSKFAKGIVINNGHKLVK